MLQAIDLALKAQYHTDPNPLVGAILADPHGHILSQGYHQNPGEEHAEVLALKKYDVVPENSILYVTLEPCSHVGKTPPCVDLLLKKGVKQVVVGCLDPNPLVCGKGVKFLRKNGVKVTVGLCEEQCNNLNPVFNKHIVSKLPYVVIKAACSLDGKIAMPSGESKWITGEQSREFGQQLRSRYQAIIVGSGTMNADNPKLTNRSAPLARQPVRVVVSSRGDLSLDTFFFADDGVKKIVFVGNQIIASQLKKIEAIGAKVMVADSVTPEITWVLKQLYQEGIYSLLVEGGGKLISSFLEKSCVDKLFLFQAGKLISNADAPSWSGELGIKKLKDVPKFRFQDVELLGEDILVTAVPIKLPE